MSFQKKLLAGDFVVLAEFDPPKGVDASDLVSNLIKIKGRVDGVTAGNGNHHANLRPG